jgi:hypothetical protein
MKRYSFKGLTDKGRLIDTMVEKSGMLRAVASELVENNLERCVEVWEGEMLCGYFIVAEKNGIRSLHGYKLVKGRTRHALRVCLALLAECRGKIYSSHQEANREVDHLLKMLGFKEIGRDGYEKNMVVMEREECAVSV